MKRFSESTIKRRIKVFLDPRQTKVHGRPIYHDVATKCGLPIAIEPLGSKLWQNIWELYFRLNNLTTFHVSKVIESSVQLITQPIPDGPGG